MLKEKLLSYIKEQTKQADFDHVDKSCTADEMSGIFTVKRNTVSHYLNKEVGKSLFKVNTRPVLFFDAKVFEERFFKPEKPVYASLEELFMEHTEAERKSREADDPLESMIGARGSLKKAIEQIKTSVFYPNTSLPVFLHGDTGAGKSYMARQIYEFSVCHGVLPEGAPFITLNCAQYANNVELLSSNLFGYVKGAFTGAYGTSKGLLEAADGGMLFLDEVHRLNNESQEKLFIFLDQGIFRRMGESEGWHKAKVRIVMATTEDLASNFLDTFLRRVPIVVEIPDLMERGYQERMQFIYRFFIQESKVLERTFSVSGNVLDALAGHNFKGNVGELQNTIKYLCATTYAKNKEKEKIALRLGDLPDEIISEIAQNDGMKIKKSQEVLITPESRPETAAGADTEEESIHYRELFEKLNSIYEEFQSQGYALDQFEKRCFHAVSDMLDRLIYQQSKESETMLMRYVIGSVHEAFRYVEYSCNVRFGGNVLHAAAAYFFYLNGHPAEYESGGKVSGQFLSFAEEHYRQETQLVKRMMDLLSAKMDLNVTEADLLPLVLYFKSLNVKSQDGRTKAIILAHGYATASSIANVANRLLEETIFEAVDMPIDKKMEDIVLWIKEYIELHDLSSGLLFLVDTGSLMDIYEELSDMLRVPVAIVNNISTQMAVNAGQMVKQKYRLEDILLRLKKYNQTEYQMIYPKIDKQKVILTCCLTGTGTAEQIRGLIDDSIPSDIDITVVSYDYDQLNNQSTADALLDGYDILGVIGTVNPKLSGIEFIPLEEVVSGEAERKMEKILSPVISHERIQEINDHLVRNFSVRQLIGSLTILDTDKIMNHIEDCLKQYEVTDGKALSNSTKINLFIHVGCLAERLIRRSPIEDYPDIDAFEAERTEEIAKIRSAFSGIENTYSVKIPLSEIGYIYDIINGI